VEALGGRAVARIGRETDYVVVGANPGSKLDKAKDLGIETIDEKEFKELTRL